MDAPFGLIKAPELHFDRYEPGCYDDLDCPEGATCTSFIWDATQDGKNFANGEACYFHDVGVCPAGEQWAYANANYYGDDGTNFSAYT